MDCFVCKFEKCNIDRFGVEHISKRIRKLVGNKIITTNIYRMLAYDSIICGYFWVGFIDFMLKRLKFIGVYKFTVS